MTVSTSGTTKKRANTSASGKACAQAGRPRSVMPLAVIGAPARPASRRDELVPLLHDVVVLVHDGVPAGDGDHAVLEGAAVANGTGLLHLSAVGSVRGIFGGLALHP